MKAFKWVKWIIYLIILFIFIIVIVRLCASGDPKEYSPLLISEKTGTDIENLGDSYIIYNIDLRSPFAIGDALFVRDVVYLESSENFQLTLRCKKNRFDPILENLELTEYNDCNGLLKLYLKITTRQEPTGDTGTAETTEDGTETIIVESNKNLHGVIKSNSNYEYIRTDFDGVKIDYNKSKVQLYVFPANIEYNEDEYLVKITLFDVNMSKSKTKIKNFILSPY